MSVAEKTCRTCGKTYELKDGTGLCPLYNSSEYKNEISMALEEFEIWNLNITQNDGLPQKICLTCFDSFCQIHNFRLMCIEAQMNFGEMCTGLDIIIKDDLSDCDDSREKIEGEEYVIVQEHYTFPGDEPIKTSAHEEEEQQKDTNNFDNVDSELPEEGNDKENAPEEICTDMKQHRCEFCMGFVSFDDPDELNSHYNELHSTELPFPCPKCELRFDRAAKRNSHARCHFDVVPLQCDKCGKKFRGDDEMMQQHIAYYHIAKERECPICKLKFESVSLNRFYYHMNWHNESKLHKCKYCEKKFIQTLHLQNHEQTHINETSHVCPECGLGFKNLILLNRHIQLHERKELIECPKCPKRYFTVTGIKLHEKKTHDPSKKPIHCEICDRTFIFPIDLKLHNHKKHGGPAPKRTKRSVRTLNDKRPVRRIGKKFEKSDFVKPYKCEQCEESFILDYELKKHSKIHEEFRPFKCKQCSKAFKREAHLKLHINNIHLKKKPHKCSLCGAAFAQRSHLGDHIAIRHENKRNYECKICQKKFGTFQILKIHSVIHSTERPHVCKVCRKTFKHMVVLKSHMKQVHFGYRKTTETKNKANEDVSIKDEKE